MINGCCSEVRSRHPAIGMQDKALQQSPAPDPEEQLRVVADQQVQTLLQLCSSLLDIAQQIATLDLSSHRQPSPAGKRVPPERAGVIAGLKNVGVSANNQGPNGVTATKSLGQGKGIRLDVQLLIAPPRSGSPHADLHFIEDQQNPFGVAEAAKLSEKRLVSGIHTTFALKWLDQHGRNGWTVCFVLFQQRLEGIKVVVREVIEAIDNWLESPVIFGLSRRSDGRQGPSVKACCSRQDHGALNASPEMAVLTGQLDGSFIGFCA